MITHLGGDVVDGDAMRDSISRPRVPRFSRVLAAAWRATLVAVAEGSDPQQARAALLGLEFRTLVTAERRYSPTVMTPSPVPGAAVTQFAVLDALLAGAYESGLRVAEARSIGDFGLGCVDHLGGEVVIVDARRFDGVLSEVRVRVTPVDDSRDCLTLRSD